MASPDPADRDLARLRGEYARRRADSSDRYSAFNPSHLYALHQRQRALTAPLRRHGIVSLAGKRILEVGCGDGGVLIEYLTYSAALPMLIGIDLLEDRLSDARRRAPCARLACANGQALPFPDAAFDLVLQYTAFSSILDDRIKSDMASEMRRVLRPSGHIIWYDFWLNPTNPQTRGIRQPEMRRLFANCEIAVSRVTLAPPIARRLVPISWIAAAALERLTLLNTHFIALITPHLSQKSNG
jgi:ubiquinone/menaquinone biosynthesis C-methylase UbiE